MAENEKNYVKYSDNIEVKQENEDEEIDQTVDSMARVNKIMFDRYRHGIRDAHAKSHGAFKAEMQIYDNLPEHLAQGVFKEAKTYPIIIRLSTAPGALLSDRTSTFRGFAIKIVGVKGKKFLSEQADALTQDILMVNFPVIPTGTVKDYLKQQLAFEKQANTPEEFQQLVSRVVLAGHEALKTVGINTDPNALGNGLPVTHILGDTFFSMAALRYGDYIAKIRVVPLSENLQPLRDKKVEIEHESTLRDLVSDFFKNQSAEYELQAQLCTNLETMPIEDGSVKWPEEESPYLPIAKITIAAQDTYSPKRRVYVDDILSFNPFHCIPEHRPLGNIMRVRRKAYDTSSRFRHEMNAQPRLEPKSINDLPD